LALTGGLLYKSWQASDEEAMITIGIIQTASHPALDQARESFKASLTHASDGKVCYIVQNAEGNLMQAKSIAENFHSHKKITAIYAIGTPAVQAMARTEKQKPIFISAVSEPESLGLSSNVCGTTDRVDTEAQADVLMKLIANVKTVGILYNPGETNSQVMQKKMTASLQKRNLQVVTLGVQNESEIPQAVQSMSRKCDVLMVPADNLLVGAMPLVSRLAVQNKLPLIASDIPSVAKGALAAFGADYGDLGAQTGLIAYQVLFLGKKPETLGVVDPSSSRVEINQNVELKLEM
jgi:putative ABC transport system substrate-binding protein